MKITTQNYYELQFLKEDNKIIITVIDQIDFNTMKIELDSKNIQELQKILGELCIH